MSETGKKVLREDIIKKASVLFLKQGYNKTTIRQIADVTGLGRGHLYYYFKKKEDILLYLYRGLLEKIYSSISEKWGIKNVVDDYIIAQYIFIHLITSSGRLFRLYIEASEVATIRKEYINILTEMFMEKIEKTDYKFNKIDVCTSISIGCAGEIELMSQYYKGEFYEDIDYLIKSIIKVRLSIIGIDNVDIDEVIDRISFSDHDFNIEENIEKLIEM